MILDFNDYLKILKSQELSEHINYNDEIVSIEEVCPTEMVDVSLDGNNVFYGNDILIHNCAVNKVDGVDNSAISAALGTSTTADMMAFLLQTEEMKQKSEILVKFTKNRYTGITDSFMMNVDYPKMKFADIVENNEIVSGFTSNEHRIQSENFANNEIKEVHKQDMNIIKEHDKPKETDWNSILGI